MRRSFERTKCRWDVKGPALCRTVRINKASSSLYLPDSRRPTVDPAFHEETPSFGLRLALCGRFLACTEGYRGGAMPASQILTRIIVSGVSFSCQHALV